MGTYAIAAHDLCAHLSHGPSSLWQVIIHYPWTQLCGCDVWTATVYLPHDFPGIHLSKSLKGKVIIWVGCVLTVGCLGYYGELSTVVSDKQSSSPLPL